MSARAMRAVAIALAAAACTTASAPAAAIGPARPDRIDITQQRQGEKAQ